MKLGFTGTQRGMTALQFMALEAWLGQRAHMFVEAHHGDCIGADAEFDAMLEELGVRTVVHPPGDDSKRAWCFRLWSMRTKFDPLLGNAPPKRREVIELPPLPYLARDTEIVKATRALIATPGDMREVMRSGTWATVRRARKARRVIRIFWPDGSTARDDLSEARR
jgi:hypothetical protein